MLLLKPYWAPHSRFFHHSTLSSQSKWTALGYFYSTSVLQSPDKAPVHGADVVAMQKDICMLHRAQNLSRQSRQEARGEVFA